MRYLPWREAYMLALGALVASTSIAAAEPSTCDLYGDAPAAFHSSPKPQCLGGTLLGPWQDRDDHDRYACLYEPALASTVKPLPLVVYIHPSLVTADSLWEVTNILEYQNIANVSDDPGRPGFIVVAPEGRDTNHYYPDPDASGPGWDNWDRHTDPDDPVENVDVATIDHFIAEEVASGKVDARRVYVTGWSNGAAMSILYGLNRSNVAAIAPYSAPDPFAAFNDPCKQTPVARTAANAGEIRISNPEAPIYHVHNDCDIAGICPNGERLASRLLAAGVSFQDTIVDSLMLPANGCFAPCGTNPDADYDTSANPLGITLGTANHVRWPLIWTLPMLDFFRVHPLK